jgi:hypothetical protein
MSGQKAPSNRTTQRPNGCHADTVTIYSAMFTAQGKSCKQLSDAASQHRTMMYSNLGRSAFTEQFVFILWLIKTFFALKIGK